jgi:hypothetical protein
MKHTKVMLAFLGSFMLTWILVSLFFSYLFESEFRTTMNHSFIFMLVLGWVPALIVSLDYNDKLERI